MEDLEPGTIVRARYEFEDGPVTIFSETEGIVTQVFESCYEVMFQLGERSTVTVVAAPAQIEPAE